MRRAATMLFGGAACDLVMPNAPNPQHIVVEDRLDHQIWWWFGTAYRMRGIPVSGVPVWVD